MTEPAAGTLRDRIRNTDDLPTRVVEVPEWGVTILMRGMTARQRTEVMQSARPAGQAEPDMLRVYPRLLIHCCYDPDTMEPVFTAEDASWLMDRSSKPVEALAEVALQLSGLSADAQAEVGKGS